ncbi:cytochrome ubiquinol oxidase subunit I [Desmospora profundinema]|uniref:Cytochrome d ubiquinol oxidase subunit I n=1 Tax=Desmospora profundinema TaxID=1571184 RepID=A0ABU1IPW5_9BACL|nr:cytochrome ubiquinol oxidase subunit I [Desmospora profundinema]MDR6226813.1 cytochrome d ubiquinol oxidase subunit I [Desmospora profundinema]
MDELIIARSLFGSSLGFHIIFATLGVGIPFMILIAELIYQWRKDPHYVILAKRWTKAQAILLGVAIPSGTIVAVQMSLLWPRYMEMVGEVIALPFQIELFAFFVEALFMSIYVYAAERLSPLARITSVFLVALGGTASAVLITAANAWMNTPTGFDVQGGEIINVRPLEAFFSPSFRTAASHVVASAYMTGAFAIASVAAFGMLKSRKRGTAYAAHKKALMLSLAIGGVMSLLTGWNGHSAAQVLHVHQPEKLAAAEGLFETQAYAPLAIGGVPDLDRRELVGGVEIPALLSFLATNRLDGVVKGLNEFPRETWPPFYVHTLFNLMVFVGTFLMFLALLAWMIKWKRKEKPLPRWLLWVLVGAGPLSMLGIEFGWVFTCSGRQPWTIYQYQLTSEAVTDATGLLGWFILFISLYVMLCIVTAVVMRAFFKRRPLEEELAAVGGKGETVGHE